MRHKRWTFIAIACCLFFGVFLLFLNWIFTAQQRLSYYEINSYRQNGLKALGLLLQQEGYRLTETESLPQHSSQPLLILSTGKIPGRERTRLLQWVKSGGTVLELTTDQPGVYPGTIKPASDPKYQVTFLPEGSFFEPVIASASGIRYRPKRNLVFTQKDPVQGFFRYQNHYFCYRTHFGKGSIISWNDLEGLTNLYIKENPDNALAFVALVSEITPSRRLLLYNSTRSEFHFRFDTSLAGLFDRYGSAFFWFLIGIALWVWKITSRFGRPQPLSLARGRSYQEFLTSMAGLFQQAGIQQVVLDNLRYSLWRIMTDITGMPTDSGVEPLVAKLSGMTGRDYTPLINFFKPISNPKHKPRLFLETARQLDHYRRELIQWKTLKVW